MMSLKIHMLIALSGVTTFVTIVSAQTTQFCANPNDYDANAVASTSCQTFNAAGCTQYGFSMNSPTECSDMPPQLCARIGGNVTTTSCGDFANIFDQMMNSQTQNQICSSDMRLGVAHFESNCCSGQRASGYCGIPDVCQSLSDFNASSPIAGECYTTQANCEAAFGRYEEHNGKCQELTSQECSAADGVWTEGECGTTYSYMMTFGVNFSSCNIHDGSARWSNLFESSCCNGNPGSRQCNEVPIPEGVCSQTQYWDTSATFSQDCDRLTMQECINAGGTPGDSSDTSGSCYDLSREGCINAGGRVTNTTCGMMAYYASMGYVNFSSCEGDSLQTLYQVEQACCGGNPGGACSQNLPQICPSEAEFVSSRAIDGTCRVNTFAQQTACVNGGYYLGGDSQNECENIDEPGCSNVGGSWTPHPCGQTRMYLAGLLQQMNTTVSEACESQEFGPWIAHMGRTCCETPHFTCGAPARICRGANNGYDNFNMDRVWQTRCHVCRSGCSNYTAINAACNIRGGTMDWSEMTCTGVTNAECGEINGAPETTTCAEAMNYLTSTGSDMSTLCLAVESSTQIVSLGDVCCEEGRDAFVCGEPVELCRNDSMFLPDQLLFEECELCRNVGDDGPSPPNCANQNAMEQSCSALGGTFAAGNVCQNISLAQCASVEGAFWSTVTCANAQYFVTGTQTNMDAQCADPVFRPKLDQVTVCCASGGANPVCPQSPALQQARLLILRFPCRLQNLTFVQRQAFTQRVLDALISRGLLTNNDVLSVNLVAQQISGRRRTAVDYVDVEIALDEDVSASEENAIVDSIEQNPIDVEIDGETFSSEEADVSDPNAAPTTPIVTSSSTTVAIGSTTVAGSPLTQVIDPNGIPIIVNGGSSDSNTAIIAGVAAAAVVVIGIIIAAVVILKKKDSGGSSKPARQPIDNPTYEGKMVVGDFSHSFTP